MGFSSQDDFIQEVTVNGKFWRQDWNKITGAAAYSAGRWYDMTRLGGSPAAYSYSGTALYAVDCVDTVNGTNMYVGGNPPLGDTKHIINLGAVTGVATGVPSVLMLIDIVRYYPGINMNSASVQALVTTTALPRYEDGKGLRSFLVVDSTVGSTAHNIDNVANGTIYMSDLATTSNHPGTIACTASAITPHITHSGTAANNFGPFLPLAAGHNGLTKYVQFKLSAASSSASTATLIICKPLATIPLTTLGVAGERDLVNQLPSLPQIKGGACLSWLLFTGAATVANTNFYGSIDVAWG